MLLTDGGLVWTVGLNTRGQLGLSLAAAQIDTPRVLSWRPGGGGGGGGGGEEELRVVRVACGCYHTILLSGDGRIHACGDNSRAVRSWSRVRASPLYRGHLMAFLWSIY